MKGNQQLLPLIASGDDALPTHVTLPENLSELVFVNYDCRLATDTRKVYRNVRYVYPDEFLRRQNQYDDTVDYVDVIQDPTGVELLIRNDMPPTYWTSFDDKVLVFDSYNKEIEDTIQSNKIQAMGFVTPDWQMTDTFIPVLPEEAFTLLLEESKSRASLKINQQADQKAEQEAGRQNRWLAGKQWRAHKGERTPNYGRRGRK